MIITFDDGYKDFLTNAWPALERADFVATIFAVTRNVGGTADWDAVTGAPLELLDWEELRFLQSRGNEIASHGALHKDLTVLAQEEILQIGTEARRVLGEQLGSDVRSFSFPWGRSNAAVRQCIADCGYRIAVHSFGGFSRLGDDPLALPRIEIFGDDNLATFIRKVGITEPKSMVTAEPRLAEGHILETTPAGGADAGDDPSTKAPLDETVSDLLAAKWLESRRATSDEDVARLYRKMLGREPESAHAIATKSGRPLIDVVLELARSGEFRARNRRTGGEAEQRPILSRDNLRQLHATFFPGQNLAAQWYEEFHRILMVHGLRAEPVLTYFHSMLSHQNGIPCEIPQSSEACARFRPGRDTLDPASPWSFRPSTRRTGWRSSSTFMMKLASRCCLLWIAARPTERARSSLPRVRGLSRLAANIPG